MTGSATAGSRGRERWLGQAGLGHVICAGLRVPHH